MPAIVPIATIGLVGGVLSGLFGIGGGLVIVPALILVAGSTEQVALSISDADS